VAATRDALGWPHAPFVVPDEIRGGFDARARGAAWETSGALFEAYRKIHPELAPSSSAACAASCRTVSPQSRTRTARSCSAKGPSVASRKASQMALDAFGPMLPELIGGSADLAHSNLTLWKGSRDVNAAEGGNYVYFGVREFGMSAISNGLALHGGFVPYDATFLGVLRLRAQRVRMSALIPAHVMHVYTHDSIGLGEDGPTHQPIEHLASLRYIPNNHVWRPCDAVESASRWRAALERTAGPSCLVFTAPDARAPAAHGEQLAAIARGGYVLLEPGRREFQAILIATGSELELAMQAARQLIARASACAWSRCPALRRSTRSRSSTASPCCPDGAAPASRGSRRQRLLAPLRGARRRRGRHRPLRRVRACRRPVPALRIHVERVAAGGSAGCCPARASAAQGARGNRHRPVERAELGVDLGVVLGQHVGRGEVVLAHHREELVLGFRRRTGSSTVSRPFAPPPSRARRTRAAYLGPALAPGGARQRRRAVERAVRGRRACARSRGSRR
jgi:transketolase C-terminal domain/subunit